MSKWLWIGGALRSQRHYCCVEPGSACAVIHRPMPRGLVCCFRCKSLSQCSSFSFCCTAFLAVYSSYHIWSMALLKRNKEREREPFSWRVPKADVIQGHFPKNLDMTLVTMQRAVQPIPLEGPFQPGIDRKTRILGRSSSVTHALWGVTPLVLLKMRSLILAKHRSCRIKTYS